MTKTIVLASNNAGKVREFSALLAGAGIEVLPQSQFNVSSVAETGLSFVENAIIKARHAAGHTGLPAIADDSGLEVDALNGAPGIYSARFSGENATDAENCRYLQEKLRAIPIQQRSARFQCVLVYMRHERDPTPQICQGVWEGQILQEPQGENGFGYDPVFYVPDHACSAAQLDAEAKNAISHRGQALRALRRWFDSSG
ncbi:MAG: RdgB/HAM1 family non-canonical purine NTP pyrophosphatase [Gammaproteobacteria bacterium]|nr:RdgB/HAM1 family non-canonical purine NTP pyrophosphatase [Gammaproteobacteria bacterium]